jgi:hypothetical protein
LKRWTCLPRIGSVEELSTKLLREVRAIDGVSGQAGVKAIRVALVKHCLDFRECYEDAAAWPNFPTGRALRNFFDGLKLTKDSRKWFTLYLLDAIELQEMLAKIHPADRVKISRMLEQFKNCNSMIDPNPESPLKFVVRCLACNVLYRVEEAAFRVMASDKDILDKLDDRIKSGAAAGATITFRTGCPLCQKTSHSETIIRSLKRPDA